MSLSNGNVPNKQFGFATLSTMRTSINLHLRVDKQGTLGGVGGGGVGA